MSLPFPEYQGCRVIFRSVPFRLNGTDFNGPDIRSSQVDLDPFRYPFRSV